MGTAKTVFSQCNALMENVACWFRPFMSVMCVAAFAIGSSLAAADERTDGLVAKPSTRYSSGLTGVGGFTSATGGRALPPPVPDGEFDRWDSDSGEWRIISAISIPVLVVLGLVAAVVFCVVVGWASMSWHEHRLHRRLGRGPVRITPELRE